jgi:hypothetical protein
MKKFYLFLVLGLVLTSSVFAQKQGISIGVNGLFPVGDWAEVANIGYGGSATYEHLLSKNIAGVLYVGYNTIEGSEDINTVLGPSFSSTSTWSMIPLLAGAKFYFSPKLDWYIIGLIGANFVTVDVSSDSDEIEDISESSTEFAFNFNFGYELKTSEKGAVDISAGYVYLNGLDYIGARLAYKFIF